MARHTLVVPGADQAPQREPGPAERRQPGPARAGEILRRRRVVRGGGAARRCNPGLDRLQLVSQVEVSSVEIGDSPVHHVLQPGPDLLDALNRRTGLVQMAHRVLRRGSWQHPVRLSAHLLPQILELRPAPVVCLVRVQVRPRPAPRTDPVPVRAHAVGGSGRLRQVDGAEPACEGADGLIRRSRRPV